MNTTTMMKKAKLMLLLIILTPIGCGVTGHAQAQQNSASATTQTQGGENIVINGSFELSALFSGTPMRQFPDVNAAFLASPIAPADKRAWVPLPAEGWYAEGADAGGVTVVVGQAHSGTRSLRVSPPPGQSRSVISAFAEVVDTGPVTLTAWVKTTNAQGSLDLDIVTGWNQIQQRAAQVRQSVPLPANLPWTQLSVTAQSPSRLQALCRLSVSRGSVLLDDVRISAGAAPMPFNVRPQEWFRLGFFGTDNSLLAKWRAADLTPRKIVVTNDGRQTIEGTVQVFAGPWNAPKQRLIAQFSAAALQPGKSRTITFSMAQMPPNAYVATLVLTQRGRVVVDGTTDFFPLHPTGGGASGGMVASRAALRFIIVPQTPPQNIFGVGNGMLQTGGNWVSGYMLADFAEARALQLSCARGHYSEDVAYISAAAGIPFHVTSIDDPPGPLGRIDQFNSGDPPAIANPAHPDYIDIYNPQGQSLLIQRAREVGQRFAQDPMAVSFQMSNEAPYPNDNTLCPSTYADADFRAWCKQRYGSLATVNAHWKTRYTAWSQIEQIISARFLAEVKNTPKPEGAAAIDWTASSGPMSEAIRQRMADNPGWAMDWLRWRTASSLRMYSAFRSEARKYDTKTLYSTNLCWSGFWPQMFMPFTRAMDVTMLDIGYTLGINNGGGYPGQMMDCLEMAESAAPDKPIWGIETYYLPTFPPEYAAFQNWALLAHGMTNNLVFDWKPYSDTGAILSPKAWEKPNAPPMWFFIDVDGSKLPAFYTYKRSIEEINRYHRRFNGLAVKRAPTDTALYVSPDTAEFVIFESGNQPWGSVWQQTRNNLIYLLRMNGVSPDYVDDQTLPDTPGRFQKIIVPASYVIGQQSAIRLARFAQRGGTVILAGVSGVCDPWLNKYETLGGPAWADLRWAAPAFTTDFAPVSFLETSAGGKEFRGTGAPPPPGARAILDHAGHAIGWSRAWGKGKIIAYSIFPDTYSGEAHPTANLTAWTRQMIEMSNLPVTGRWVSIGSDIANGTPGTGSPVVEVVTRQKSVSDRFIFCLNQGGPGDGTVEVPVPGAGWHADDVITGQKVTADRIQGGQWRLPLHLSAFGYQVFHLSRSLPIVTKTKAAR